jgi:Uma2 family endonuclease
VARPAPHTLDDEAVRVPRTAKFPVELEVPPGFVPADAAPWPQVDGRLEWVDGRLLWMPPCGTSQQVTVTDVVVVLGTWARAHPEFAVGTNEAGMHLGDDVRGADAAVWRRESFGPLGHHFATTPPVLAVEVSGRDEREPALRAKVRWYLDAGTTVVWIMLVDERRVIVVTRDGDASYGLGDTLPPHPALPGLAPAVGDLFRQLRDAG